MVIVLIAVLFVIRHSVKRFLTPNDGTDSFVLKCQ